MHNSIERQNLLSVLEATLKSVNGRQAVSQFVERNDVVSQDVAVLAIGKAAFSMFEGAADILANRIATGLLITRDGYLGNARKLSRTECLLAGHPVPDERSLLAGHRLIEWLTALPVGMPLVALISGGTSAMVEKLPPPLTLSDLQQLNQWLLSSGLNIEAMNHIRQSVSMLKGGRLRMYGGVRPVIQLMISDVPGDDPAIIGSGLFIEDARQTGMTVELPGWLRQIQSQARQALVTGSCNENIQTAIVASNSIACEAARQQATTYGYQSQVVSRVLQGDVHTCADQIMVLLDRADPGCYIWGGETTIQLPEAAGRGGRNQHLALLLARKMKQTENYYILCIGTDGSDGNTEDAGALIDGGTIERGTSAGFDVDEVLRRADAGSFLDASGDLVNTGPTGTNVMDMIIALKLSRGIRDDV